MFAITAGFCRPASCPRWFFRLFSIPKSSLVACRAFSALNAIHFFTADWRISPVAIAKASAESRRYLKWARVFRRFVVPGWPVVKTRSPSFVPVADHFR